MSLLDVCRGTGQRQNRGRLFQKVGQLLHYLGLRSFSSQCTNLSCNTFIFYTPAYNLDDAKILQERVATRLVARSLGHDPGLLVFPPFTLRTLQLRDTNAPCDCGKNWNQKCTYDLCKACCDKNLKQGSRPYPCSAPHHSAAPSKPAPAQLTPPAENPTPPPPSRPITPASPTRMQNFGPPPERYQKFPTWQKNEVEKLHLMDGLVSNRRQKQLLEAQKRTIKKVYFYHTVRQLCILAAKPIADCSQAGEEALILSVPLPQLPNFKVNMVEDVIKYSSLDENSYVDVYAMDGWTTVRVDQLVQVDSKDILLRFRHNLRTPLSPTETPGLDRLVSLQGRIIPSHTKRGGSELVSPVKPKVQKPNSPLPPLPSLLASVDSSAVRGIQRTLPTQQPSLQPIPITQDPRFPGEHSASFIISGLDKLDQTKGEGSVGDRYKRIFGRPTYPRATLSKMREKLEPARRIFATLPPERRVAITWSALLQMVVHKDEPPVRI